MTGAGRQAIRQRSDRAAARIDSSSSPCAIPGTDGLSPICARSSFRSPPSAATHLSLLHLRAGAARGQATLPLARRGARHRRVARPQAVPRRCSRWATSLELRYQAARDALKALGYETTISYLTAMCAAVLRETGLLPHANPGVMTREEIAGLREVTASQGIMLESTSERLCRQGGVHYGSPDKHPLVRLETLRRAGELKIPFTTGILIGIGETRDERIDALEAIRDLHATHGHIQEVII